MASGLCDTTVYHLKTDTEDWDTDEGQAAPRGRNVVRGFSESSTAHGVPQIYRAKGVAKKAVWIVFSLLGVAGLTSNLILLILQYKDFPVTTKITLFQNRSLPFPAVTICNTNPIKSSKAVQEPRILALLESWGIAVNGTLVRDRKKSHHESSKLGGGREKRSTTDVEFIQVYAASEGFASVCTPDIWVASNSDNKRCLELATEQIQMGQDAYTVVNIDPGVSCYLRACQRPLIPGNLQLTTSSGARDIYIRAYNECSSDPCVHGKCVDTVSYYSCVCDHGYTGNMCDTGIVYFEHTGRQCTGEDLISESYQSVDGCQELCSSTLGCVVVQFVPSTGMCHIKGECLTMTRQEAIDVYMKKDPTQGYSVYSHLDCPGHNLLPLASLPSALECSLNCDEVVSCVGFVFSEHDRSCWIKETCNSTILEVIDNSLGYRTYIKTGGASVCAVPRARIECPGSYPGITESQCLSLTDCCFDTSQPSVAWCYLDTLKDLHHSHLHTVFRAAQKSPTSPNLYSLWVGEIFTPGIDTEVSAEYFSEDDVNTEVYKSALVECMWDRMLEASVMLYDSGDKKMSFQFEVENLDKVAWYSQSHLTHSSYPDATMSTTYKHFSIGGGSGQQRRWFISQGFGKCSADTGWFVVVDRNAPGPCVWDSHTEYPVFLYSRLSTIDKVNNFLTAETFFTKARLDDSELGGDCVSACLHLSDGLYQSCLGCNVYVVCTEEVLRYHACHTSLVFDVTSQTCDETSITCRDPLATGQCLPNECTQVTCYHGGSCTMATHGWQCLCQAGFTGLYCEVYCDHAETTVGKYTTTECTTGPYWTTDHQTTQSGQSTPVLSVTLPATPAPPGEPLPPGISPFLLDDFHNPPINYSVGGLRDDHQHLEELFKILAEMDDSRKKDLGYTLSDLIVICEYMEFKCTDKDFEWFFDAVHGNCYVFNSNWNNNNVTKVQATEVGRRHGLRLTLDIGQYEYIPKIGEAAGVVVVVHSGDQMSFPEDEGVVVLPGRRTAIAIRAIDVHRLPLPYGDLDCFDETQPNFSRNVFEELYSLNYGLNACYKTCYQRYIVQSCGCGDPQYPIKGVAFGNNSAACDVNHVQQESCKQRMATLYTNNELACDCQIPCNEKKYKYTVSQLSWPSEKYEETLLDIFRQRYELLSYFDLSEFRRNLVGLEVYFEDFNYESIEEYPSYLLSRLFTDFGGVIGLWVGCSLFSLAEILELGLDLIILACYRFTQSRYRARRWNWTSLCCCCGGRVTPKPFGTTEVSEYSPTCDHQAVDLQPPLTALKEASVLTSVRPANIQGSKNKVNRKKKRVVGKKRELCGECEVNYWKTRQKTAW